MLCKILRLFVNILAADDKYSFLNRENLTKPIEILLSQRQKNFFSIFISIFEIYIKFLTFKKEIDPQIRYVSEITDSEKGD